MINKKWIAAGYAAALTSIILVVVLLGTAFLSDKKEAGGRTEPPAEQTAADTDSGRSDAAEGEAAEDGAAAREEKESYGEEGYVEEQSDLLSTVMDQTNAGAEILTLSGKELWSRFDGAVLTGDSRVVGFALYTDIRRGNVKARNGATIAALPGFVSEIAALDPDRVFVAYGINDIKSAVGGNTAEAYAQYAEKRIGELEEALDGAEIFVNSILPVSPQLERKDSAYSKVPDYNAELEKMCLKRGWHFIDNSNIAVKYGDLYVSDGIHLKAGFYEHWGRNMLLVESGVHID